MATTRYGESVLQSWSEVQLEAPDIAAFGKARLDGKIAYLATVRGDGSPRVHPVTAVMSARGCFVFADPESSKVRDLEANPAFSLHCAMSDSSGSSGEFQMHGKVRVVVDDSQRLEAEQNCTFRPSARSVLFELLVGEMVATSYRGGRPDRRRWRCKNPQKSPA